MNWSAFTNGDFNNSCPETDLEREMLRKASGHLTDLNEFKRFYNQNIFTACPEFFSGFPLDVRLQTIANIITQNKYTTVMDIGCRVGILLFHLATRQLISRGLGLDVNISSIGVCKEYRTKLHMEDKLEFKACLIEEYVSDTRFDCVVMADVLEHVVDPIGILKQASAYTNYIIASFPSGNVDGASELTTAEYREHVRLLDKSSANAIFRASGWEIKQVSSITCYFPIDVYLLEHNKTSQIYKKSYKELIMTIRFDHDDGIDGAVEKINKALEAHGLIVEYLPNTPEQENGGYVLAELKKIDPATVISKIDASPAKIQELSTLHVTPAVNLPVLEVVSAKYHAKGIVRDVKVKLLEKIIDGRINIIVDNGSMGVDPLYGAPKKLSLVYKLDNAIKAVEIDEGYPLNLP